MLQVLPAPTPSYPNGNCPGISRLAMSSQKTMLPKKEKEEKQKKVPSKDFSK